MITEDLIKSKISDGIEGSPSGCYCVFVKITDKIGAKLYRYESERDYCYDFQYKAAEYNLGPEVYGKFNLELDKGVRHNGYLVRNLYGYLTEIVETYPSYTCGDKCSDFERRVRDKRSKLIDDLYYKIGFDFTDAHMNNMGFKGDKLVCIDFG